MTTAKLYPKDSYGYYTVNIKKVKKRYYWTVAYNGMLIIDQGMTKQLDIAKRKANKAVRADRVKHDSDIEFEIEYRL